MADKKRGRHGNRQAIEQVQAEFNIAMKRSCLLGCLTGFVDDGQVDIDGVYCTPLLFFSFKERKEEEQTPERDLAQTCEWEQIFGKEGRQAGLQSADVRPSLHSEAIFHPP